MPVFRRISTVSCLFYTFAVLLNGQSGSAGYEVRSIAGPGETGDRGTALEAMLRTPSSLAIDSEGNVFFADKHDHRVRRVAPDGKISTVAGTGLAGFSGDGGPATAAKLDSPVAVAIDAKGNLIIADSYNLRIRQVSSDGFIRTIAGSGGFGSAGDGGPAISADLGFISSMVVDASGNIVLGDDNLCTIRQIYPSGKIATIAGKPGSCYLGGDKGPAAAATLYSVTALAFGQGDNLFIASACRIRVITRGTIYTSIGNGECEDTGDGAAGSAAHVSDVQGLHMDKDNNLYIASPTRVRRLSNNGVMSTVIGGDKFGFSGDGGPAVDAVFRNVTAVIRDPKSSALLVTDSGNHRIRRVDETGKVATIAGSAADPGDGPTTEKARLQGPWQLAIGPDGSLFVADVDDARVRKIAPDGSISTVAGNGIAGAPKPGAKAAETTVDVRSVAVDKDGNLYIGSWDGIYRVAKDGIIRRFAGDGTIAFRRQGATALSSSVLDVEGMVFDANGNLFFSEAILDCVAKVTRDGAVFDVAGFRYPWPDFGGDGGPALDAYLAAPGGLSLDAAGNLYIADTVNARIRMVTPAGNISTIIGNGDSIPTGDGGPAFLAHIGVPGDVKVDANSNVWVTDFLNRQIRRIDNKTGRVSTVARGLRFDQPDGSEFLLSPAGLAFSATGETYVGDFGSHRILKLIPRTTPCAYSMTPAALDRVPASGQSGTLAVTADSGCTWTAATDRSWISLLEPVTGSGSGSVGYRLAENRDFAERSGRITVASATVAVTQLAAVNPGSALISEGGIVNAAGYQSVIAPLSYVSIFGRNLSPAGTRVTWDSVLSPTNTNLPTALAGVSVKVAGKDAYIYAIDADAGIVNILLPSGLPSGAVKVELTNKQGTISANATVQSSSPAFFAYSVGGKNYPAALFANETVYVAPEGAISGAVSRPARAGDFVVLYANALGSTADPVPVGCIFAAGAHYPSADLTAVKVTLGGVQARVLYAGMVSAGLWQINIQVPEGIAPGAQPVQVEVLGSRSPSGPVLEFR